MTISQDIGFRQGGFTGGGGKSIKQGGGSVVVNSDGSITLTPDLGAATVTLGGSTAHLLFPLENDAGTPTLGFGGGGDGLYQRTDTTLSVALVGAWAYNFSTTNLSAVVSGSLHASLRRVSPTATVPSVVPSVLTSDDTGLGLAAAGQLSLIAGGVEQMRIISTGAEMPNGKVIQAAGGGLAGTLDLRNGGVGSAVALSGDTVNFTTGWLYADGNIANIGFSLSSNASQNAADIEVFANSITLRTETTAGVFAKRIEVLEDKIGFFTATPVVKPVSTNDIKDSLVALGLITDGGATPLDLDGGALTIGQITAAGNVTIGTEGGGTRRLEIKGSDATGSDEGGEIQLFLADDFDTTISSYVIDAFQDDLRFFGVGGTPNMTLTAEGYFVQASGAKTTTGDPTSREGMIYWNTVDNAIRMFADGAWRTLASW